MLEGFGLYPVVLQIDPDSYEGDWRHVARFRNRTGWLLVAEAEIWVGDEHRATMPLIVGCDQWDEPIPSLIAANLLRCASSLPQACDDYPPALLDLLVEQESDEVRQRWLRETNAEIALIHEAGERAVRELEEGADAQMQASDRLIADLSQRRRMLPLDHPGRAAFSEAIANQEDWQTGMIGWLTERRQALRSHYEAQERDASRGLRPRLEVNPLYVVNWHHADTPAEEELEAWEDATRPTRSWFAMSGCEPDLSVRQLLEIAAFSKGFCKPDRASAVPPAGKVQPPIPKNRLIADWKALGDSLGVSPAPARYEAIEPSQPCDPPTVTLPEPEQVQKADPLPQPQAVEVEPSPAQDTPVDVTPVSGQRAEPAQQTLPEFREDLRAERARLSAELATLELKQVRFRAGSPEFVANKVERGILARRLAALELQIGQAGDATSLGGSRPLGERPRRDLVRAKRRGANATLNHPHLQPADDKERVALILNLEELLKHHPRYTGDWFKLNEMLAEARAALRGDGKP